MLSLYRPKLAELDFRRKLLADPATMTYNHACGGVIDFPRERWADWYKKWSDEEHFYRYLRSTESGAFVGEAAYHWESARSIWMCDIIVMAEHRGQWYGSHGLELLCAAARANGLEYLYDDIAADNPAVQMFLRHGFQIVDRRSRTILVRKDLRPHVRGGGAQ